MQIFWIVLNKDKLKLCITEVPIIGHVFSKNVLKTECNRAKVVLQMPCPQDVEGVQRLNGSVNYFFSCQLFGKVPAQTSGPHGADTLIDKARH